MPLSKPFRGIIPPLITPLNEDFTLDYLSLIKTIDHVISGGVDGIFILGTTGEFSSLSPEVKNELISMTCAKVDGRIPVLVGITNCSFNESLKLAAKAKNSGAKAVVAAPPFYMNIDQKELINYYQKLADQVELPLLLYNMPSHTGINIDTNSVEVLSNHPNIIGIKDSSGDLSYFESLCDLFREKQDFTLLVGPEEHLLQTMNMGGHGGVCGGANLFPALYVKLYEAILTKNSDRIQALQVSVLFLSKNLYTHGNYQSDYLKGLKASMAFSGLCKGILAMPLFAYSKEEKESLRKKYDVVEARIKSILK
ncbi:dihydrodipicolinate synthase family protein [Algoriphagus antarcticus]|uniref:4-hydroxy-tetrahydrodipicolinate synthase n=1 Tax=Algoriphagus antarcticus TaxID=238540 RepID=A0A3E0DKW9_9BACT|nr:dihydrodipicolinate synthase family protein [Algoriphagus antarcticus]REG82728.1 4-hydroxy-tetrahydrodipicolinate synthase [Algoriphagus antarcticus]